MKYFEFGQEHPELMVMLHGGGVCYRGALPVAEEMAKIYHVVLVAYDGFNPDEPETEFKSVPDEARRLGDYIVEHYGGKIDILYGVSYGTFILMDVLADDRLTITTTIADGMPTMDYADIKNPILQDIYIFFLTGFSYWLIGKAGPIRKKIVCKMMDRSEESFDRIVYHDATWQLRSNCSSASFILSPFADCTGAPPAPLLKIPAGVRPPAYRGPCWGTPCM